MTVLRLRKDERQRNITELKSDNNYLSQAAQDQIENLKKMKQSQRMQVSHSIKYDHIEKIRNKIEETQGHERTACLIEELIYSLPVNYELNPNMTELF